MSTFLRKMVQSSRARAEQRIIEQHMNEAVTPAARMEIEALLARRSVVR